MEKNSMDAYWAGRFETIALNFWSGDHSEERQREYERQMEEATAMHRAYVASAAPSNLTTPSQIQEGNRKEIAQTLFNLTFGGTCDPTLTEMAEAIAYSQADAILALGYTRSPATGGASSRTFTDDERRSLDLLEQSKLFGDDRLEAAACDFADMLMEYYRVNGIADMTTDELMIELPDGLKEVLVGKCRAFANHIRGAESGDTQVTNLEDDLKRVVYAHTSGTEISGLRIVDDILALLSTFNITRK